MDVIEVAIAPVTGSDSTFRVEVVRSAAGEASTVVELDVAALMARRALVQQTLLASSVRTRRMISADELVVQQFGQELFAAVLGTGEVAGRYRAAGAVAATRAERLRVVLRIGPPRLASLPWEAMHDQDLGRYVCRQSPLIRHVPVASLPAPLQVNPPLRILGVVSSPRGLPQLDTDRERQQLEQALAYPVRDGLVEVRWAPTATWADLHVQLMDGPWHVLHYIGHGDFAPDLDEGILALEREDDGRTDRVGASRMVDLLAQAHPMPRLVVLNSCSGGAVGVTDLFSSTAAALVRGGVGAVVAMQYAISDAAAISFCRGFYAAIARGRGVDEAVTAGRIAILGTSPTTLEWVTPVLYLRGDRTHLYAVGGAHSSGGPYNPRTPPPSPPEQDAGWPSTASARAAPSSCVDPNRAHGLLRQAEDLASAIRYDYVRASVLADVARTMADTDRGHAIRLIADAKRIAQSEEHEGLRNIALRDVAVAAAAVDPSLALESERIAPYYDGQFVCRATYIDPGQAPEEIYADPVRLAADAVHITDTITDQKKKARALREVAELVAISDPDRAARIARMVADEEEKARALREVALAMAGTHWLRASILARAIADEATKERALGEVAQRVAGTDPDRAVFVARRITSPQSREWALARVAEVAAGNDPDQAEGIARSVADPAVRSWALSEVAQRVAATDPDRAARLLADAEHASRTITSEKERAPALARIAEVTAAIDPDGAQQIAQAIADERERAWALRLVAVVVAGTDPGRAVAIANTTIERERGWVVGEVARLVASTDHGRAVGIANTIADETARNEALGRVAEVVAATDPDQTVRIAHTITNAVMEAATLRKVAEVVAATDPERALRIADTIADQTEKAKARVAIAKAFLPNI